MKASPLARRIARERGIDLAQIAGTGPEGRVIAEDVEKAAVRAGGAERARCGARRSRSSSSRRRGRRSPDGSPRPGQAPVFQLTVTADATELVATRERMVELMREGDTKPTVSDVLTRLVASALVRHRPVNANFVDGKLHRFSAANVGLAVAAPAGLVVPVIRDADRKSVQQIAADRADLVSRARDGKLQLADLEGGTFTISNLGMYGIEQFVAVLNPPQVAILAVGSIEDRPAAIEGEFAIVPTMTMTLTCDHRAIDGSEGAEFLRDVKAYVERPALALVASFGMVIRRGGRQDVRFLRDMLHHAYYWRERNPGDGPGPAARYVKGWGRPGDTVLIAIDDGFPVGAAWYRLFRRDAPGLRVRRRGDPGARDRGRAEPARPRDRRVAARGALRAGARRRLLRR